MRNEKEHLLRKRPRLEGVKDKAIMASPTGPTGEVGGSGVSESDPSCVPGQMSVNGLCCCEVPPRGTRYSQGKQACVPHQAGVGSQVLYFDLPIWSETVLFKLFKVIGPSFIFLIRILSQAFLCKPE